MFEYLIIWNWNSDQSAILTRLFLASVDCDDNPILNSIFFVEILTNNVFCLLILILGNSYIVI